MRLLENPKDFFLYIATAITLYASAGSLIGLLLTIIDVSVADALNPYVGNDAQFGMAVLIIVFPIYLILSYVARRGVVRNPERAGSTIRRWFIYLTLFLAGALAAGDVVALVNTFLQGEITTRFILKVIAVFVVAGVVFAYYFYDLRRTKRGSRSVHGWLAVLAAVAVLAVIVWGFAVLGTPGERRMVRFDQERVSDLQNIQSQVTNYWQNKRTLPRELSDLEGGLGYFDEPTDPETDEPYEYRVTGALSFELCANFALPSIVVAEQRLPPPRSTIEITSVKDLTSWEHPAGEHCFERTIDPDFFPER